MFTRPIPPKTIGFLVLIPAGLLLAAALGAAVIVPVLGVASGIHPLALIPFLLVVALLVTLAGVGVLLGVRYLRGNPLRENRGLGLFFLAFGVGYLAYSGLTCLASNLTGNRGGYAGLLFAILMAIITVPIGLGLKNGYRS